MFFKMVFLINLLISQENNCVGIFFNKVAGLNDYNFILKRLQHRCFPVKFVKFLKTSFITEHLWWLLLDPVVATYEDAFLSDTTGHQAEFSGVF